MPNNNGLPKQRPIRVTTWENVGDKDIESWFSWLKAKDIPAAMIRKQAQVSRGLVFQVSVWKIDVKEYLPREPMKHAYDIIKECHGFAELILEIEGDRNRRITPKW